MVNDPMDDIHEEKLAYDPETGWEPSRLDRLDQIPKGVFEAIEAKNLKKLAYFLRGGEPKSLYTDAAIAAYLDGKLPPKRKAGRPHGGALTRQRKAAALMLAECEFKMRFEAAGSPSFERTNFEEAAAKKCGIEQTKLYNHLRRSKKQRPKPPVSEIPPEEKWWDWMDAAIVETWWEWKDRR